MGENFWYWAFIILINTVIVSSCLVDWIRIKKNRNRKTINSNNERLELMERRLDAIDKKIEVLSERSIRMEEQIRNIDHKIFTSRDI